MMWGRLTRGLARLAGLLRYWTFRDGDFRRQYQLTADTHFGSLRVPAGTLIQTQRRGTGRVLWYMTPALTRALLSDSEVGGHLLPREVSEAGFQTMLERRLLVNPGEHGVYLNGPPRRVGKLPHRSRYPRQGARSYDALADMYENRPSVGPLSRHSSRWDQPALPEEYQPSGELSAAAAEITFAPTPEQHEDVQGTRTFRTLDGWLQALYDEQDTMGGLLHSAYYPQRRTLGFFHKGTFTESMIAITDVPEHPVGMPDKLEDRFGSWAAVKYHLSSEEGRAAIVSLKGYDKAYAPSTEAVSTLDAPRKALTPEQAARLKSLAESP